MSTNDDLNEKFVSDDGVSSVEGPVVPAGGPIKDKEADVRKKIDPKAEKHQNPPVKEDADIDEDANVVSEESEEVSESFDAIFEGMDLSEDFKSKISLVFEAAVNEAAAEKAKEITESLEEEFEAQLQESVNEAMEGIVENLDKYLDYVVSEWMEENAVAIESGIKVEMAESFMEGLKELFYEHNVEIDEETVDVVAALEEELIEAREEANRAINEAIALAEEAASLKAEKVFNELSEGLTATQVERLRVLSEKLDHDDLDAFASDLSTLKESFFKKAPVISEAVEEEEEILVEDTSKPKRISEYDSINYIANFLNSRD